MIIYPLCMIGFFTMFAIAETKVEALSTPTSTEKSSSVYPSFSDIQRQAYRKELLREIDLQEKKVETLKKQTSERKRTPSDAATAQFEYAVAILEVKKILFQNLIDSEVLQSPVVREKLLSIMKSQAINTSDLSELQNVINKEREKMKQ
jgi:hypothetical protein